MHCAWARHDKKEHGSRRYMSAYLLGDQIQSRQVRLGGKPSKGRGDWGHLLVLLEVAESGEFEGSIECMENHNASGVGERPCNLQTLISC